jgi:hypothetical protein
VIDPLSAAISLSSIADVYIYPVNRLLCPISAINRMPSPLQKLSQVIEYFQKSFEPLDQDGAHPVPSLLARKLEDLDFTIKHGQAFSVTDIVSKVFHLLRIIFNSR